ncbi:protein DETOXIFICATION 16 [Cryptomeria japonica]|uniref:protein DETOXIFICATION 16 n=1 Tax=Cryptomeria japonica TaxID=3369 RepID=UPI0027D9FA05|nr:protein DETOXIFICATION 16 [Cryptomeria japonica]
MEISDSIQSHEHENDMLDPLLVEEDRDVFGDEVKCSGGLVWEEVKNQCWIAGPMVSVNLIQYSMQVMSVMVVGHLGELELSSASIATSFAGLSGFSVLMGMGSTLETLCGQAYGAKQYHQLGIHVQRAFFALSCVSLPLAVLWAYMGNILTAFGQDPLISTEAGKYARWMIPSLFGFAAFQPLWWAFEILILSSGLLPNPKLETSVLSICLNTSSLAYTIPFGFSAAVSTRVSNALGAGRSHAARLAVYAVFFIAITEAVMIGCLLFSIRNVWGYAYSNEKEVIEYIASMIPLVAASSFLDGIQCILSGIARGCGWQNVGAYVNLGAYYIVAIPIAVILAFVLHVGGRGIWLGIICGLSVQAISLFLVTTCTGWEQQARNARERVYASSLPIVTNDMIKDDKKYQP